jgi:hypothetical protein
MCFLGNKVRFLFKKNCRYTFYGLLKPEETLLTGFKSLQWSEGISSFHLAESKNLKTWLTRELLSAHQRDGRKNFIFFERGKRHR